MGWNHQLVFFSCWFAYKHSLKKLTVFCLKKWMVGKIVFFFLWCSGAMLVFRRIDLAFKGAAYWPYCILLLVFSCFFKYFYSTLNKFWKIDPIFFRWGLNLQTSCWVGCFQWCLGIHRNLGILGAPRLPKHLLQGVQASEVKVIRLSLGFVKQKDVMSSLDIWNNVFKRLKKNTNCEGLSIGHFRAGFKAEREVRHLCLDVGIFVGRKLVVIWRVWLYTEVLWKCRKMIESKMQMIHIYTYIYVYIFRYTSLFLYHIHIVSCVYIFEYLLIPRNKADDLSMLIWPSISLLFAHTDQGFILCVSQTSWHHVFRGMK